MPGTPQLRGSSSFRLKSRTAPGDVSATMALDSAATFNERVFELGLVDHLAHFQSIGWLTYGDLAHDTRYVPGGDEDKFDQEIVMKGLGDINHAKRRRLRRLFFEAYTIASGDLKRVLEAGPDDPPRVIPSAERLARRKRAAAALPGLALTDELNISDALLDRAIGMYDSNAIGYISMEMCTKKASALLGVKKEKRWEHVPNAYGKMELQIAGDKDRTAIDSQFAYIFALQRRGLALFMGNIMDFKYSEMLRSKLIAALMKPPSTGFLPVTMNQVIEADFVFWTVMEEHVVEGIKTGPNGRPCDNAFMTVFESCEFRMALMNRQAGGGGSSKQQVQVPAAPLLQIGDPPLTKRQKKNLKVQQRPSAIAPKPQPPNRPSGPKPPPAKALKTGANLPRALIGMCNNPSAASGAKAFCYAFNINGCNDAVPGASCARGFHGCMKPLANGEACSGPHAASACTR